MEKLRQNPTQAKWNQQDWPGHRKEEMTSISTPSADTQVPVTPPRKGITTNLALASYKLGLPSVMGLHADLPGSRIGGNTQKQQRSP